MRTIQELVGVFHSYQIGKDTHSSLPPSSRHGYQGLAYIWGELGSSQRQQHDVHDLGNDVGA